MGNYSLKIQKLIEAHPLKIDQNIEIHGNVPQSASSEFLTNKEQGDWAERLVQSSINTPGSRYIAIPYGRSDSISAGEAGFRDFYESYLRELNTIGKRPDLLIFKREDAPIVTGIEADDENAISHAVAALEVRSSSFLSEKYKAYMKRRTEDAMAKCSEAIRAVMEEPYRHILKDKSPQIYALLTAASDSTFRELDFRAVNWSSSPELRHITEQIKIIKACIKLLHRRDYLSITPKIEDLVLVNRWIQRFNVPHYYLQVFFDRAYILSFEDVLNLSSNPDNEGKVFSIEGDIKNQGKRTIKIDIEYAKLAIREITMPELSSAAKELDRGRLIFYVKFNGEHGMIDSTVINELFS